MGTRIELYYVYLKERKLFNIGVLYIIIRETIHTSLVKDLLSKVL